MGNSNAIIAKTKAKYGQFLKASDYNALLKCKSVSEVVAYLKNNTHYKSVLEKVNENEIHRAQAEDILRQSLFINMASLCRYETGISTSFSNYIVRDYEINLIIHYIVMINANKSDTRHLSVPSYFLSRISIDINALAKAKDFDELLTALSKTRYEKMLLKFKSVSKEQSNIAEIENVLVNDNYRIFIDDINAGKDKKEKDETLKYLNRIIDYLNYVRIFRLKKYYNYSPMGIKKMLIPFGTINDSQIDILCSAEDCKDLLAKSRQMPIGYAISRLNYAYPGEIGQRGKFALSRKNMYLSTNASVVLISFMFISQIELNNVIILIEGARYNVSEDKIKQVLIY